MGSTLDDIFKFVKENFLIVVVLGAVVLAFIVFVIVAIKKVCLRGGAPKEDSYLMVDPEGKKTRIKASGASVV